MDSTNNSHSLTCAQAEDALVRASYESLNSHEEQQLQRHVEQCDACRALAATLTSVQSVIAETPDNLNVPAFSLAGAGQAPAAGTLPGIGQSLRTLFDKLCNVTPMYQVAGAVAMVVLVVVAAGNIQLNRQTYPMYPAVVDSMDTGTSPDSLLDTLRSQPQPDPTDGVGAWIDMTGRNHL